MPRVFEQGAGILERTWECKQCHQRVGDQCVVAYHLIDGVLYGWCESCFSKRGEPRAAPAPISSVPIQLY
jgi:hypothetical protein